MVYRSYMKLAMLSGSETMLRSMCGVKLVDRKNIEKLMEILGLKDTLDRMAKANGVRWYGQWTCD